MFVVRQVCEKYLANTKAVFWTFMDLEKAYNTNDWARHVADAKSVWSWRKIVESSIEFLCR